MQYMYFDVITYYALSQGQYYTVNETFYTTQPGLVYPYHDSICCVFKCVIFK